MISISPAAPISETRFRLSKLAAWRKTEELGQAVLQVQQCGDDPQYTEHTLRPSLVDDCHLPGSFGAISAMVDLWASTTLTAY